MLFSMKLRHSMAQLRSEPAAAFGFSMGSFKPGFPFLDWLRSWDKRFQKKKMQHVHFMGAVSQSLIEG